MVLADLYSTFLTLKNDNLAFIYQGDFSDDITTKIINLSEYNISNIGELSKLKKKVSLIMVECFQNIIRHGEAIDRKVKRTTTHTRMFIARNIGTSHYITSANLIENENIPPLKQRLDKINNLSKEELKALYLDILSNVEVSEKGGAGLGLVEMARKSGERLEYDFVPLNDKVSYFYLQSKISPDEKSDINKILHIPINVARDFHQKVINWNILMIYKGDFSQSTILPMLRMIENNMSNQFDELKVKKIVYIALVEILQNISKHSKELKGQREGIFLMGQKNKNYIISSGNLISNNEIVGLKHQLDLINSLDKEELNRLYRETIIKDNESNKNGAGLGLIDIARESDGKIEYSFIPYSSELSFFSLIVKV